ncbi:11641_t:CDS:2 [Paraglomus brasilianum]|uniref:11641_t:CDS:1 n=1 Tax=Paraglomus brasilianum TaxID=144538 RepID=A0A9N8ZLG9_9GLOM|nr:11641_t:CDS:2 [Paraglomus brasilianum]
MELYSTDWFRVSSYKVAIQLEREAASGSSIYGSPFADEFHSRLRFVRRGLVAMANAGSNDNGSQFFITLDRTEELQNKHTIFGKVAGDTIFNVIKMGEAEIDNDERPLYPTTIISTEVLYNPFDDIIPRITAEEQRRIAEATAASQEKPKKKKAKKNVALLSFGDEANELEDINGGIKSSHDLVENDPRLSKEVAAFDFTDKEKTLKETKERVRNAIDRSGGDETAEDFDRKMKETVKKQVLESIRAEELKNSSGPNSSKIDVIRQEIQQVLERLRGFQQKLHTVAAEDTIILSSQPEDTEPCSLHSVPNCLSCRDTFGQSNATDTDEGWLSHQLVFEKDYKGKDLMQRRDDPNDYVVIDPLERKKQAIEEQREKRAQRSDIGEAFQPVIINMDCEICHSYQRKFYCINCLRERLRAHHVDMKQITQDKQKYVDRASKLVNNGLRDQLKNIAEKHARTQNIKRVARETERLREEIVRGSASKNLLFAID